MPQIRSYKWFSSSWLFTPFGYYATILPLNCSILKHACLFRPESCWSTVLKFRFSWTQNITEGENHHVIWVGWTKQLFWFLFVLLMSFSPVCFRLSFVSLGVWYSWIYVDPIAVNRTALTQSFVCGQQAAEAVEDSDLKILLFLPSAMPRIYCRKDIRVASQPKRPKTCGPFTPASCCFGARNQLVDGVRQLWIITTPHEIFLTWLFSRNNGFECFETIRMNEI